MLKFFAGQLSGIFQKIITQSLSLQTVAEVWKHATIVPIAKCTYPKVLNDFRPVALTSLVMKTFVRVNGVLSKMFFSTGSLQGCVLSSLLYILYTNDCRSAHENRHLVKCADDTVIVSLLNNTENSHGPLVDYFVEWCERSHLYVNVSKMKDMLIHFRKVPTSVIRTSIQGEDVELVREYKYLGTIIDNELRFESNTDAICRKIQQILFFLRNIITQITILMLILFL